MKHDIWLIEQITPTSVSIKKDERYISVGGTVFNLRSTHARWYELHDCSEEYDTCPAVAGTTGAVCTAYINSDKHLGNVYCDKQPEAINVASLSISEDST